MEQCDSHYDGDGDDDGIIIAVSTKAMKLRAETYVMRNSMSVVPFVHSCAWKRNSRTSWRSVCPSLTEQRTDRPTARTKEPLISTEQYDIIIFVNTPENEEK